MFEDMRPRMMKQLRRVRRLLRDTGHLAQHALHLPAPFGHFRAERILFSPPKPFTQGTVHYLGPKIVDMGARAWYPLLMEVRWAGLVRQGSFS